MGCSQAAGLKPALAALLQKSYPLIQKPTPVQAAIISEVLARPRADLAIRAHTGTGKSFAVLLALLQMPRIKIQLKEGSEGTGEAKEEQPATASIVLVPSAELARQYAAWARQLFPISTLPSLDPILQVLVRTGNRSADDEQVRRLHRTPPHVIVATPARLNELVDMGNEDRVRIFGSTTVSGTGRSKLAGIRSARTLVLDEADALLDLPARFERGSSKSHAHRSAGLTVLDKIMGARPTCSGGEPFINAGMEPMLPEQVLQAKRGGRQQQRKALAGADIRPDTVMRLHLHRSREEQLNARGGGIKSGFRAPRERAEPGADVPMEMRPLQLVCISATLNAVFRHFLGAKTGWMRIGNYEHGHVTGKWLDFTGLTQVFSPWQRRKNPEQGEQTGTLMPAHVEHHCLVVDEAPPAPEGSSDGASLPAIRQLQRSRNRETEGKGKLPDIVPADKSLDGELVRACAMIFALQGVQRGLVAIPPGWSILRTQEELIKYGVPTRVYDEAAAKDASAPVLYLLQSSNLRGVHVPDLTHVFILDIAVAKNTSSYVHLAGRVGRLRPSLPRAVDEEAAAGAEEGEEVGTLPGKVITLIRGLTAEQQAQQGRFISKDEVQINGLYKLIGLRTKHLALQSVEEATAEEPQEDDEAAAAVEAAETEGDTTTPSETEAEKAQAVHV